MRPEPSGHAPQHVSDPDLRHPPLGREWLATNGLGGYAAGTPGGAATRRYHGLLIAALPAPHGRRTMLNHLTEWLRLPDGTAARLDADDRQAGDGATGSPSLADFHLDAGLPVWRYEVGPAALEKRLLLPHGRNTVLVRYRLLRGGPAHLMLHPAVHFRPHGDPVSELPQPVAYRLTEDQGRCAIHESADFPPLRLHVTLRATPIAIGVALRAFTREERILRDVLYRVEGDRGYPETGDLWCPGYFSTDLAEGGVATFLASTEDWDDVLALRPEEAFEAEQRRRERLIAAAHPAARSGPGAALVLAADQFLVSHPDRDGRAPARLERGRPGRSGGRDARAPASTVIAGYYWFNDWGRDTMISLEGLTLCTGRHDETGNILRTFAQYIHDGLIPDRFPEGDTQGVYNTADATLWFVHAIDRYLDATHDTALLRDLLPHLQDIVAHHLKGTDFGIGVDPKDGLLKEGAEGYQLTWMDAKVGDWVVTPRRGKAVEINALWFNALKLIEGWQRDAGQAKAADELAQHAERAGRAFNERFWYAAGGYLYDVVDCEHGGDDSSCRPNQIIALSLRHPVLAHERWEPVLNVVRDRLLTPVGLRSLAPGSPDFKPRYYGDRRSRDAAYHQGTVWPWLLGPYIDAWLRVHPGDRSGARALLDGVIGNLGQAGLGTISEIFDAEEPFIPRGCVAQAWSVAEALRGWVKTAR